MRGIRIAILAALLAQPALADDAAKRQALLDAYPGLFQFEGDDLVWSDGTRMVWDDGKARTAQELIDNPDIEDMFAYVYPLAAAGELVPAPDFDPGRIRNEAFFKKLYGGSAKAVEAHLATVKLGTGGSLRVTTLFGVADKLKAVGADMTGTLAAYAKDLGGGFNWRVIAGTTQLSVHAFGAAVDVNTGFSDYWRWAGKGPAIAYKNRIPLDLVALFEAQGFIWGGRWYHYDTMHFEYRPELLLYARGR